MRALENLHTKLDYLALCAKAAVILTATGTYSLNIELFGLIVFFAFIGAALIMDIQKDIKNKDIGLALNTRIIIDAGKPEKELNDKDVIKALMPYVKKSQWSSFALAGALLLSTLTGVYQFLNTTPNADNIIQIPSPTLLLLILIASCVSAIIISIVCARARKKFNANLAIEVKNERDKHPELFPIPRESKC